MTAVPRRALIVSADIGEGHNSAGRALEQAIARAWPGCKVRWLDTLDAMGPGAGPLARAFYTGQVQPTPWLYEFLFSALRRHRWFLDSTRRFIGSLCGRRMARRIRAFDPDVIVSTYPLGSAGLSWLRRHRELRMPVGAWVPAFFPHPYWVYGNLDVTYVMHDSAARAAARAEPGARIAVGALPVRDGFAPADQAAARARLSIGADRFVVALCTGSLALGGVQRAVTALLAADVPALQVIVVCGRNGPLRRRLEARGEPPARLRVLGWTDDMPGLLAASDVVVSNAGGATALEALATARPLVMFEPIAGHGRANAALLASSGLAVLAPSPPELAAAIRRLVSDPAALAAQARAAQAVAGRRPEDDLAQLAAMASQGPSGAFPVRAEDALFLHVHTEACPQDVGAVVLLNGDGVGLEGLRSSVAARVSQIPRLRRRLLPASGRWARARWAVEDSVDVRGRIHEVTLGADGAPASLEEVVGRFFSEPFDPEEAAWQLLLVHGHRPGGAPVLDAAVADAGSAIVVKAHHALGDSYALISALSGLFDPEEQRRAIRAKVPAPGPAARATLVASLAVSRRGVRVARGLVGMALAPLVRPMGDAAAATQRREFAAVSLDSRRVALAARRLRASPADMVLALVADALGRRMAGRGEPSAGTVRAMVPRTLRSSGRAACARGDDPPSTPRRGAGSAIRSRRRATASTAADPSADFVLPGNRTVGLLLDLPVGPMSLAERVAAVRAVRLARLRRGDADAVAFVLRAMNVLPVPLRRALARTAFTGRRFSLIVSVFPGMRRTHHVLGTEVSAVFPVLALADGVGLGVGAITWGQSLSIGLLADPAVVPDVARLGAAVKAAFADSEPVVRSAFAGREALAAGETPANGATSTDGGTLADGEQAPAS